MGLCQPAACHYAFEPCPLVAWWYFAQHADWQSCVSDTRLWHSACCILCVTAQISTDHRDAVSLLPWQKTPFDPSQRLPGPCLASWVHCRESKDSCASYPPMMCQLEGLDPIPAEWHDVWVEVNIITMNSCTWCIACQFSRSWKQHHVIFRHAFNMQLCQHGLKELHQICAENFCGLQKLIEWNWQQIGYDRVAWQASGSCCKALQRSWMSSVGLQN